MTRIPESFVARHLIPGEFTTRQLQVYTAVCLRVFCEKMAIRHESVDRFIAHRIKLALSENLPQWESEAMALELTGLGDPLPKSLVDSIPASVLAMFHRIVESCAEVGFSDMYGADTDRPRKFAHECLGILRELSIQAPEVGPLDFDNGFPGWGAVFPPAKLAEVLEFYRLDANP